MTALPATRRRTVLMFGAAAGLVSCGGGEPAAGPRAAPLRGARVITAVAPSPAAPPAPTAPLEPDQLFDWAERTYPQYFPGHETTRIAAPYEYRHYPASGNYVGVAGDDVFVLGPVSGGELLKVGTREDFRCRALPASCAASYPRTGWAATLSSLQHGVRGSVSIVDARSLRLSGFYYDGLGPLVYVYLANEESFVAFSSGLAIGPMLQRRRYDNESFDVQLPEGQTLDGFNAVSIWCVQFRANFGSGRFAPAANQ